MLSRILSKESCANCRFCCSFRRCSLWETPLFDNETVEKLTKKGYGFISDNGFFRMYLDDKYKTNDESEEVPCYFLDSKKGCILDEDTKPFDCKIWPLRVMKKDDKLVIALTPTCKEINKIPLDKMKAFVNDEVGKVIFDYVKKHPYIVKEYREDFPVLMYDEN